MTYGKPRERMRARRSGFCRDLGDVRTKLQPDRSQEVVELARFPLGHELDAAVGSIANVARHLEVTRHVLAGDAETHTLHPAREVNSATNQRHETPPRGVGLNRSNLFAALGRSVKTGAFDPETSVRAIRSRLAGKR